MNLCNDNHEEVCYEGRNCPVCYKMNEISDLEDQIKKLELENEDLKSQLE